MYGIHSWVNGSINNQGLITDEIEMGQVSSMMTQYDGNPWLFFQYIALVKVQDDDFVSTRHLIQKIVSASAIQLFVLD